MTKFANSWIVANLENLEDRLTELRLIERELRDLERRRDQLCDEVETLQDVTEVYDGVALQSDGHWVEAVALSNDRSGSVYKCANGPGWSGNTYSSLLASGTVAIGVRNEVHMGFGWTKGEALEAVKRFVARGGKRPVR